jgi:hypothetical protein
MTAPAQLAVALPPVSPPLKPFEENVTSQCGEDGVIRRALEIIGARDRWCVEFGAWDGRHASNTFALIDREGYSAVLIESDRVRYEALVRTHSARDGVTALHRQVSFEGPDRLDEILAPTRVPPDFDLLSIDIDGNDYHVWEALQRYRPKLVVIEFNPTIPNEIDFVQPRDLAVSQGSSLTAVARLAAAKRYRLIHATAVNGIFVDDRYFARFNIDSPSPAALRADLSEITWLFQTYDGMLHVAGNRRARWHDVPLDPGRLQVVPRWLRGFPPTFAPGRRLAWRAWRASREPRTALDRLSKRLSL